MIDIELVNPFFDATVDFLYGETGVHVSKGTVCETSTRGTTQDINVLIGVTGVVRGQIIYSMSTSTAKAIAGSMLVKEVDVLDRTVQSALCELGNMISGMSISKFPGPYSEVALTPPSLIAGKDIFISVLKVGCYYTSIMSELGNIDVTVALETRIVHPQPQPAQHHQERQDQQAV